MLDVAGMSRGRVISVYALVAVIVAGSAAAMITQQELYPFSPFQMFSGSQAGKETWRRTELVWVFDSGEGSLRGVHLRAMTETNPSYVALRAKQLARNGEPEELDVYLGLLAALYDRYRVSQLEPLPPLLGLRVYDEIFALEAWAENRREPTRRKLVHEMLRP